MKTATMGEMTIHLFARERDTTGTDSCPDCSAQAVRQGKEQDPA